MNRSRIWLPFLLATLAVWLPSAVAAQDAPSASAGADGASVPTVRVNVSYPERDRPPSRDQVDNSSLVTIEEFPEFDPDGPVVSEALDNGPQSRGRVLATLAGDPITEDDLVQELLQTRGRETFDWLVGREILRHELARHRLQIRDWEVEDQLQKHLIGLRKAFPHLHRPDDLTRAAAGMPLEEYRQRTVWSELALRKIMRVVAKPSDEDLRRFYADIRVDFIRPERVRISQVFIAPQADPNSDGIPTQEDWRQAERLIIEAHNQIRMGKDFPDVIRAYGGGQASRWVGRGELLRELEEPAFSISPGSITTPIRSSMGYHALMVEEREERAEPPFEEVRDEVLARFLEEQFVRKAGEFMDLLKEKALDSGELVIDEPPPILSEE